METEGAMGKGKKIKQKRKPNFEISFQGFVRVVIKSTWSGLANIKINFLFHQVRSIKLSIDQFKKFLSDFFSDNKSNDDGAGSDGSGSVKE